MEKSKKRSQEHMLLSVVGQRAHVCTYSAHGICTDCVSQNTRSIFKSTGISANEQSFQMSLDGFLGIISMTIYHLFYHHKAVFLVGYFNHVS